MSIKTELFNPGKKRAEVVAARARILAGIKAKHEEEILDEAFRMTEAIRGELDSSLQTLRKTVGVLRLPNQNINKQPNVAPPAESAKTDRPAH